jgi:hypothetical protein
MIPISWYCVKWHLIVTALHCRLYARVSYIGGFENFCFVAIARNEAQFVECTEFRALWALSETALICAVDGQTLGKEY